MPWILYLATIWTIHKVRILVRGREQSKKTDGFRTTVEDEDCTLGSACDDMLARGLEFGCRHTNSSEIVLME